MFTYFFFCRLDICLVEKPLITKLSGRALKVRSNGAREFCFNGHLLLSWAYESPKYLFLSPTDISVNFSYQNAENN